MNKKCYKIDKKDELIYQITKVIAESDSIGEGYSYCKEYTKEMFVLDKKNFNEKSYGNSYFDVGKQIMKIVEEKRRMIKK